MGVVNVEKIWDNGGTVRADEQGNMSYDFTVGWTVLLDSPVDGERYSLYAAGIPALGDFYSNTTAHVINKAAKALGPWLWMVTCQYAGQDTPLSAIPEISWSSAKSTEPIDRDSAGNAILNPNGDRITGVVREVSDLVYTVVRNVSQATHATHRAYLDAVNSGTFMGFAAKKARVVDVGGQRIVAGYGVDWYWRETIRIQFRIGDDWRQRILVEGYQYWTGITLTDGRKELLPFKLGSSDENDPRPHPLNADGTRIAAGHESDPAYHTWVYKDVYSSADFSGLGIS